jgi:hypothetical protein
MKNRSLFVMLAALLLVGTAGAPSRSLTVRAGHAQAQQRFTTESLGITRGQALVADLASFPDGVTKLVLRDPNGRVGIILAVSDGAGAERARIEFYDARGMLVRTLDASSSGSRLEQRVKLLEDISLPRPPLPPGGRQIQSNEENLWIKLEALDRRVRALEKEP